MTPWINENVLKYFGIILFSMAIIGLIIITIITTINFIKKMKFIKKYYKPKK